jgi:hypothetical protein
MSAHDDSKRVPANYPLRRPVDAQPITEILAKAFANQRNFEQNRKTLANLQSALAAPAAENLNTVELLRRALVANPALTQAQKNAELLRKAVVGPLEQHKRTIEALRSALTTRSVVEENLRTIQALRKARTFSTPLQSAAAEAARKSLTQRNVAVARALREAAGSSPRSPAALRPLDRTPLPLRAPSAPPRPRPWWFAAVQLRTQTLSLIFTFDSTLSRRLDGAWERVARGGPHSASQAAHSTVEFVDWVFRAAAPGAAVIKWHSKNQRPAGEIQEGKPTRTARMRYLLRERDPDGQAATTYVRLTNDLINLLQGIKHTADDEERRTVAASIMALESALVYFFAG